MGPDFPLASARCWRSSPDASALILIYAEFRWVWDQPLCSPSRHSSRSLLGTHWCSGGGKMCPPHAGRNKMHSLSSFLSSWVGAHGFAHVCEA